MTDPVESSIFEHLLKLQNRDGGWGSGLEKQSNPEATAYALMALVQRQEQVGVQRQVMAAVTWLLAVQDASGGWNYAHRVRQGSWVTAPVILALSTLKPYQDEVERAATWLLQQRGERLGFLQSILYGLSHQHKTVGMNPNLQGWSWASGTTSWVEPTAYALIALNKLRPALDRQLTDARIRQAEALLYDRMCVDGGWNYGNAVVLNQRLVPYPDTTALSLIALQAHQDKHENQISLNILNKMIEREHSGLTLSWAIICRFLYGQTNAPLKSQLLVQYQKTMFLGQTKSLALSLLALGDPAVFQV